VARGHVDRVHRGGAGPCSAVNVKAAPERQTRRWAAEWGGRPGRWGLQNVTGCILSEGERDAQFCRVAVAVACSWISTVLLETRRAEPMVAREHDASSMPRTPRTPPRPPRLGLQPTERWGREQGAEWRRPAHGQSPRVCLGAQSTELDILCILARRRTLRLLAARALSNRVGCVSKIPGHAKLETEVQGRDGARWSQSRRRSEAAVGNGRLPTFNLKRLQGKRVCRVPMPACIEH
jgi:hypothetical protein